MKKVLAIGASVIVAAMFSFSPATADEPVLSATPVAETAIVAPVVQLTEAEPSVQTTPAPVVETPAPVETAAPVATEDTLDTYPAPTPSIPAPTPTVPTDTATPAPRMPAHDCLEDEPCWNCETMGNHICGAVPEETLDNWLARVCDGPKLGDAYAGIMRNCYWQEAVALNPNLTYVDSGFIALAGKINVASPKYPGIIHTYQMTVSQISTPANTATE